MEDTAAFEDDVCSVLTEQQLNRLAVEVAGTESEQDHEVGPACRWRTETRDESFTTALLTADGEGLSSSYENADDDGLLNKLEPISGHPAIAVDLIDRRDEGYCNVAVGLRDDLSFYVGLSSFVQGSPFYYDPCGAAYEIAAMAVETMKGAE